MKILVFTDWFFPGSQAGGPIQSLISMMKHSEDQFFVVTRNTDLNSTIPYAGVLSNQWVRSFAVNIQVYYLNEAHLDENFISRIHSEINPEKIYLNSMWSPKFTLLPLRVSRKNGWSDKVVLAPRGMLKPAAFNQKGFKKKLFLLFAKMNNFYGNIQWHATSEIEQTEIKKHFPNAKIRIAPNISNAAALSIKKEIESPFKILTVGRISPEKGYYEALEAMRLWNPNQIVLWDIVGLKENAELVRVLLNAEKELATVKIQIHGHKNLDELKLFYEKAHVFFLPSRGENYGHAIAEALSNGIPVVLSDQTPWENLEEAKAGKASSLNPMHLSESLDSFVKLNPNEYHTWSQGALNYAKLHVNSPETLVLNKNLFK